MNNAGGNAQEWHGKVGEHYGLPMVSFRDALWPEVPEFLAKTVRGLTDEQIDKVTHLNAIRWLRHDLFKHYQREELTVGALRAKATDVDTTPISTGGNAPLEAGEAKRRVTSGDIMKMMQRQSEQAEAAEA